MAMNPVHKFRSEYGGLTVDETAVIYRDPEDQCWLAHGLRTDLIGAGDTPEAAFQDLQNGIPELLKTAHDFGDEYLCEAPPEIQKLAAQG